MGDTLAEAAAKSPPLATTSPTASRITQDRGLKSLWLSPGVAPMVKASAPPSATEGWAGESVSAMTGSDQVQNRNKADRRRHETKS